MKALVKFHRDFVIATLIEVIGLDKVRGRPSADVVKEYYRRLPKAAQELVTSWTGFQAGRGASGKSSVA